MTHDRVTGVMLLYVCGTSASLRACARALVQGPSASATTSRVFQNNYELVWLSNCLHDDLSILSPGAALQSGDAIIVLPNIISEAECADLLNAGVQAADAQRGSLWRRTLANLLEATSNNKKSRGRTRVPIKGIANSRPFDDAFAKVLRIVDEELPSVVDLFQTDSVGALHASDDLEFSAREPAFNLYREGGDFNAHVDRQTLTVLLYLTPPDSCEGGGTGFWSHDTAFGATANPSTDAYKPPTVVLDPPVGTALLYGGRLMHAGMPVTSGMRAIFLGSFSAKRRDLQLLEYE